MQLTTTNPARRPLSALCLTLVLAVFSSGTLASHEASEPSDGTVNSFRWLRDPLVLPEISIQQWPGERVKLSSFKGKFVLLNLWATWCPPCVHELPALDRLQGRLGGEDFVVVAVSVDRDPASAQKMFSGRLALDHLIFYAEPPERLGKVFPLDVLPSNFIINRDGNAIGLLRSYVDWDSPEADSFVKRLVNSAGARLPDAK
jgi:thiol-disulfide isomerase/thioredoxin